MVYTSGHQNCKPLHSYGPAVRSSYMLHYIHSGKGTYSCDKGTWQLKAGDLFLMIPGERIFYQADAEDPWEYSWIGLQGLKAGEYLSRSSIMDTMVCHIPEDNHLPEVLEKLQEASGSLQ